VGVTNRKTSLSHPIVDPDTLTVMDVRTLILSAREVRAILDIKQAVSAVELAFAQGAEGHARMPPKVYLSLEEYNGDFRAMPSFLPAHADTLPDDVSPTDPWPAVAGVKWVNSHPDNPARYGLPSVMGVYILSDPATARPLAILDATVLTAARTGAAAAVASSYLARQGASSIGFVGAGVQARWMLDAHRVIYGDTLRVMAADVRPDAAEKFAAEVNGTAGSIEEVCRCDIVCTSTPSRSPVVRDGWIRAGTHINAMGADGPGKQELDPAILSRSIVVIDEHHQATHSGEINVPISEGKYREDQIFATLGELILRKRSWTRNDMDVTLFDSTGLAIQDVALARWLYHAAKDRGVGTWVDLVGA
jgi:alanine dehydrogenase